MKTKRKTDGQRAFEWIRKRDNYNHYATFTAALRSERRAVRKEIGERLNGLLDGFRSVAGSEYLRGQCEGIREAMQTLNIKEQK